MISPESFYNEMKEHGIDFYTGVPDSLLKDFCSFVNDNVPKKNHIINSNEGAAIALASGYNISTGKIPVVYMQNSGLGNAINPLLSLADPEVYSIPMILLIGWRGKLGEKDEPQHRKQGRVMLKMLEAMEVPYKILDRTTIDTSKILDEVVSTLKEKNCPYAIVISEGTFEKYEQEKAGDADYSLSREQALEIILSSIDRKDIIVSTTGKTSREIFEYREKNKQGHETDFLTVGSMGHCSQIALGIAMMEKEKKIFVIDGDGAVIMHMGSLSITGTEAPGNFKHIVINNGAHESVGGQPTAGFKISLTDIAKACGYKSVIKAMSRGEVEAQFEKFKQTEGPVFFEIYVNKKSRKDLGRPDKTPLENKKALTEHIRS